MQGTVLALYVAAAAAINTLDAGKGDAKHAPPPLGTSLAGNRSSGGRTLPAGEPLVQGATFGCSCCSGAPCAAAAEAKETSPKKQKTNGNLGLSLEVFVFFETPRR